MSSPPMSPEQRFQAAQEARRQGRTGEAEAHYRALIESHGPHPALLIPYGLMCAELGRLADAADLLGRAAVAMPGDAALLSSLGAILHGLERNAEAVVHLERAVALQPGFAEAHANLGSVLIALGRHTDAYAAHTTALSLNPHLLGVAEQLGFLCLSHHRSEEAVYWYEKARAENPQSVKALIGLGTALEAMGRASEALPVLQAVLARDPGNAAAHHGLGDVMLQTGQIEPARQAFARAVALMPDFPAYHRSLAGLAPFVPDDPRLGPLEALQAKLETLADEQKPELHFALAKAYDDLGRVEQAFGQYAAGNAAKRRLVDYDEAAELAGLRRLADIFTPELLAAKAGAGHPSPVPVFVIGMPRSGTTLVERIIAAHPQAHGAGEPMFLFELIGAGLAGKDFPAGFASLPDAALSRLGGTYATRLGALAPQATRIVDKLPANFRLAGLIATVLPQARIIHLRRNPLDTCFSCFATLFAGGLDYTYDLGELGRYYNAYTALMAHWRMVLPATAMLELDYETLVGDFETEARRLIAFCGLSWDARCLDFHHAPGAVRTASAAQVRRPLNRAGIGRWKPYEAFLGPLLAELEKA